MPTPSYNFTRIAAPGPPNLPRPPLDTSSQQTYAAVTDVLKQSAALSIGVLNATAANVQRRNTLAVVDARLQQEKRRNELNLESKRNQLAVTEERGRQQQIRGEAQVDLAEKNAIVAAEGVVRSDLNLQQLTQKLLNDDTARTVEKFAEQERLGVLALLNDQTPEGQERAQQFFTEKGYRWADPAFGRAMTRQYGGSRAARDWQNAPTGIRQRFLDAENDAARATVTSEYLADMARQNEDLPPEAMAAYLQSMKGSVGNYISQLSQSRANQRQQATEEQAIMITEQRVSGSMTGTNPPSLAIDAFHDEVDLRWGEDADKAVVTSRFIESLQLGAQAAHNSNTLTEDIEQNVTGIIREAGERLGLPVDTRAARNAMKPMYAKFRQTDSANELASQKVIVGDISDRFAQLKQTTSTPEEFDDVLVRVNAGIMAIDQSTPGAGELALSLDRLRQNVLQHQAGLDQKKSLASRMADVGVNADPKAIEGVRNALSINGDPAIALPLLNELAEQGPAGIRLGRQAVNGTDLQVVGKFMLDARDYAERVDIAEAYSTQASRNQVVALTQIYFGQGKPTKVGGVTVPAPARQVPETNGAVHLPDGIFDTHLRHTMVMAAKMMQSSPPIDKDGKILDNGEILEQSSVMGDAAVTRDYIEVGRDAWVRKDHIGESYADEEGAEFLDKALDDLASNAIGSTVDKAKSFKYNGKVYFPAHNDGNLTYVLEWDPTKAPPVDEQFGGELWKVFHVADTSPQREQTIDFQRERVATGRGRSQDESDINAFMSSRALKEAYRGVNGSELRARRNQHTDWSPRKHVSGFVSEIESRQYSAAAPGQGLEGALMREFEAEVWRFVDHTNDLQTMLSWDADMLEANGAEWDRMITERDSYVRGKGYKGWTR